MDLAKRSGIDQTQVPSDEFCEGVLGVLPKVAREQFHVAVAHVWKYIAADPRNPPWNFTAAGKYGISEGDYPQLLWRVAPKPFTIFMEGRALRVPDFAWVLNGQVGLA